MIIIFIIVGEWGGECGKQVGSMNDESQVSSCYNITFIYTNQETVEALPCITHIGAEVTAHTKRQHASAGTLGKRGCGWPSG